MREKKKNRQMVSGEWSLKEDVGEDKVNEGRQETRESPKQRSHGKREREEQQREGEREISMSPY